MTRRFAISLLASVAVSTCALAQGPRRASIPPHLVLERLSRMSPEERENLLGRLPGDRRALLEDRLRRYREMPEAAKQRLREEYNLFQQLPPEKQEDMRRLFRQLGEFPPARSRALRRELVRLRNMTAEHRAQRMTSGRFKEEFSEPEREFLSNLMDVLTAAPTGN